MRCMIDGLESGGRRDPAPPAAADAGTAKDGRCVSRTCPRWPFRSSSSPPRLEVLRT